ncbi:hypothetical protein [Leptolyngbya sp. FACHB-711]|uniref:hypothetical protein n=1 Tax=unclassified Leptolyngbya TaxID=2650499 RepID=UPI001689E559|nr:hypothetical protein [Leptolyngbya sp. FACHB-711]MBD1853473.1 hypothetical protein [Cyanobacteria bacterium FACHB-502]MBD2027462.1 hypothetical protein [Leptolyngbya sp. FACHB-711]
MMNALLSIALVQSLVFAAEMRLALRGDDFDREFNHGENLDAQYWLYPLFLSGLPLLRLRLALRFAPLFFTRFEAGLLEQPESHLFRQSGRARWQLFAGSTPC